MPETPAVDSLPLTAEILNKEGVFLMDCGWKLLLFISVHAPQEFFGDVIGKINEKAENIIEYSFFIVYLKIYFTMINLPNLGYLM